MKPSALAPLALAVAGAFALGCGTSSTGLDLDTATEAAFRTIVSADLATHVAVLADDSLLGRSTPSPGIESAARYVTREFRRAGLDGGLGGGFEQRFPLFGEGETAGVNVIGWLEGSDPASRSEYVVVSAHMDHIGVGLPVAGDSIYNGADDNASGTAALLELAEALASLRPGPRRSVVFAAFSAEERGLWGSSWYVADPPFPIEATVANLNMDMIGRNWRDTIAVLRSSPAIGSVADRVGAKHGRLGLAVARDPWPDLNLIGRSDQQSFIRGGVEGLLLTSGLHEDYHRPSDEADRLDYEKMERVARLAFLMTLDLADPSKWP